MRIGITAKIDENFNPWLDERNQLAINLCLLLADSNIVDNISIVNLNNNLKIDHEFIVQEKINVIRPNEVIHKIDMIICLNDEIDKSQLSYFRHLGKKLILIITEDAYYNACENSIFEPICNKTFNNFNEVWIFQDNLKYVNFISSLYKCSVKVIPLIWSSWAINYRIREIRKHGLKYSYENKKIETSELKVLINEKNDSTSRSCFKKILAVENYYRGGGHFDKLYILNTENILKHKTFVHLIKSLTTYRNSKLVLDGKNDLPGYISKNGIDLIICGGNSLNQYYSIVEAAYGGYVVLHSALEFHKLGDDFYYNEDNIYEISEKITNYNMNEKHIERGRIFSDNLVWNVNTENISNKIIYESLLLKIQGET